MNPLASGKVERLRQNESRGKRPLVVAADTGLISGEGVRPAMIGGPTMQRPKEAAMKSSGVDKRAATISTQTSKISSWEAERGLLLVFQGQPEGKSAQ